MLTNKKLIVRYPTFSFNTNKNSVVKNQVRDTPQVEFMGDEGSLYTLLMVDPQANPLAKKNTNPTEDHFYSYLHWLVVNIPSHFDLSEGIQYQSYLPPTPPSPKNRPNLQPVHSYYFQVYKQPSQIMSPKEFLESPDSKMFNTGAFVAKNRLSLVAQVKMAVSS